MAITEQDITRLTQLASLELNSAEIKRTTDELSGILTLIDTIKAANTEGASPMSHPLCGKQTVSLRLRPDEAKAAATAEQRDQLMSNAPASSEGLFLVPTVIE